ALKDGDVVSIDIERRRLEVDLSSQQLAQRLQSFSPPSPRYPRGVFAKYTALVSSAAQGAVTGFLTAAPHSERSKRNGSNLLRQSGRPGSGSREEGRDHRLRKSGARARPEPEEFGRRRAGWASGYQPISRESRASRTSGRFSGASGAGSRSGDDPHAGS